MGENSQVIHQQVIPQSQKSISGINQQQPLNSMER